VAQGTLETPWASWPFVVLNETRYGQFGFNGSPGYTFGLDRLTQRSPRFCEYADLGAVHVSIPTPSRRSRWRFCYPQAF